MVVWVLTWWSVVDWQWCFGGLCCLCIHSWRNGVKADGEVFNV